MKCITIISASAEAGRCKLAVEFHAETSGPLWQRWIALDSTMRERCKTREAALMQYTSSTAFVLEIPAGDITGKAIASGRITLFGESIGNRLLTFSEADEILEQCFRNSRSTVENAELDVCCCCACCCPVQ